MSIYRIQNQVYMGINIDPKKKTGTDSKDSEVSSVEGSFFQELNSFERKNEGHEEKKNNKRNEKSLDERWNDIKELFMDFKDDVRGKNINFLG